MKIAASRLRSDRGVDMTERHRLTISISDEDKALADKQLASEKGTRNVSQSMRLPAFLSLLIERQLHAPRDVQKKPARKRRV